MLEFKSIALFLITICFYLAFLDYSLAARPENKETATRELLHIADDIKKAVLNDNIEGILKYVSKTNDGGILCTDTMIPYKVVERDIKDPKSYLHLYLFNPSGYREKYAKSSLHSMALKEYFQQAMDLEIDVNFLEPDRRGFTAADVSYLSALALSDPFFPPTIFFSYHEHEGWTIGNGLYGCSGY